MARNTELNTVRALLKLVDKHQVDQIQCGNILITKTRHGYFQPTKETGKRRKSSEPKQVNPLPESVEEIDEQTIRMLELQEG